MAESLLRGIQIKIQKFIHDLNQHDTMLQAKLRQDKLLSSYKYPIELSRGEI